MVKSKLFLLAIFLQIALLVAQCPSNCRQSYRAPNAESCCPHKDVTAFSPSCLCHENQCIGQFVSRTKTKPKGKNFLFPCVLKDATNDCDNVKCNDLFDKSASESLSGTTLPNQSGLTTAEPLPTTTLAHGTQCLNGACESPNEECFNGYCYCKDISSTKANCLKRNLYAIYDKEICLMAGQLVCKDDEKCVTLDPKAKTLTCRKEDSSSVQATTDRCIDGETCKTESNETAAKCINMQCYCATSEYCKFNRYEVTAERCEKKKFKCHENAHCYFHMENGFPAYGCACNDGYDGNGTNCTIKALNQYKCFGKNRDQCKENEICMDDGLCYCQQGKKCPGNALRQMPMGICFANGLKESCLETTNCTANVLLSIQEAYSCKCYNGMKKTSLGCEDKDPVENQTTPKPEDVTTAKPGDVTTAKPEDVTTAKPEDVTTAKPEDVTTAKPEDVTTAKPEDVTTAKPEDVTTAKPEDETTKPDVVTTPKPIAPPPKQDKPCKNDGTTLDSCENANKEVCLSDKLCHCKVSEICEDNNKNLKPTEFCSDCPNDGFCSLNEKFDKQCKCKPGFTYNKNDAACVKDGNNIKNRESIPCKDQSDCGNNAKCLEKVCYCNENESCHENINAIVAKNDCTQTCAKNEVCTKNVETNIQQCIPSGVEDEKPKEIACSDENKCDENSACINKVCYCKLKESCPLNRYSIAEEAQCELDVGTKCSKLTNRICIKDHQKEIHRCVKKNEENIQPTIIQCNEGNICSNKNEQCLSDSTCYCKKDLTCQNNINLIVDRQICTDEGKSCQLEESCTVKKENGKNEYSCVKTATSGGSTTEETEKKAIPCVEGKTGGVKDSCARKSKEVCMEDDSCYCYQTQEDCNKDNFNLIVDKKDCDYTLIKDGESKLTTGCPADAHCVTENGGSAKCKCIYPKEMNANGNECTA